MTPVLRAGTSKTGVTVAPRSGGNVDPATSC